jgi:hypothetical protein
VNARQNIQKGAVGIGREIKSLRREFAPHQVLPHDEGEPKRERNSKPAQAGVERSLLQLGRFQECAASHFERDAAEKQHSGIQLKEARKYDVDPISGALPHIQRAGERRERHGDREDSHPDSALVVASGTRLFFRYLCAAILRR